MSAQDPTPPKGPSRNGPIGVSAFAFSRSFAFVLIFALALAVTASGCVERILQVRSEPPGARVHVNGVEAGTTPCDVPFTFYGTVGVTLRREGYESHRELVPLSPPWYQIVPMDFVTEFLCPWPIRDLHELDATLVPSPKEIDAALRRALEERNEEMRVLLLPASEREGSAGAKPASARDENAEAKTVPAEKPVPTPKTAAAE